ncbi:MAG: TonB-dependent receptor [Gammaproteobacteria bacterium AqS3]|nr:TonB-dependent receptor [Gammaproteobacteria bacterium AqS3]
MDQFERNGKLTHWVTALFLGLLLSSISWGQGGAEQAPPMMDAPDEMQEGSMNEPSQPQMREMQEEETPAPARRAASSRSGGVYMEEIIVTAEKREASVQDTAAAINAFDDAALEREGIETISDIQFAVPNMTFSAYNFGTPHLSIRGISRGVVGVSGDDATSVHVNGAYAQSSPILLLEFFDLERVEILRGPQGTLYGRNSTGGIVNFITAKPDMEAGYSGSVSQEIGSDGLARTVLVGNLPITENLGARIATYVTQQDGFTENTYTGNTIDGRDLSASRFSLRWQGDRIDANLVLDYFEEDDTRMRTSKQACKADNRPAPFSIGCEAGHDLETFDAVNPNATLAQIWANQYGLYGQRAMVGLNVAGLGNWDGFVGCKRTGNDPRAPQTSTAATGTINPTAACSYQGSSNLREVASVTDPSWFTRYRSATLNVDFDLTDSMTLSLTAHNAYQKYWSVTDYNWNTGSAEFLTLADLEGQIGAINAGLASVAKTPSREVPCAKTEGTNRPGCMDNDYTTRNHQDLAAYYNGTSTGSTKGADDKYVTVGDANDAQKTEVNTALAGAYANNAFLTGVATTSGHAGLTGITGVLGLTTLNVNAHGVLFPAGTPTPDPRVAGSNIPNGNDFSYGDGELSSFEVRLVTDMPDSPWDFIGGFFYMESDTDSDYQVHANSLAHFATVAYQGLNADNNTAANASKRNYNITIASDPEDTYNALHRNGLTIAELSYYNNQTLYEVSTWAIFGEGYYDISDDMRLTVGLRQTEEDKEIIAGLQSLIAVSEPNRQQNRPRSWSEMTGRASLDYRFAEDAMFYATLANSYKSGGLNPPSSSGAFPDAFDPEYITSIEFGVKSTIADGRVQLNATYFTYDYEGYQTSKIVDRTSVNENIDVENSGIELEVVAYPTEALRLDFNFAWLDTSIIDTQSIDTANPTAGMMGWTTIKGLQAATWIAPTMDLNDDNMVNGADAVYACQAANISKYPGLTCAAAPPSGAATAAIGRVPIIKNKGGVDTDGYEAGVTYAEGFHPTNTVVPVGFETDISGNRMAEAPETSIRIAAQYTMDVSNSFNLVIRGDYYQQSEFYGRVFNSDQNLIPAWDIINASVALESTDQVWNAKFQIKNLADDDHITGLYFTDASSGNFTNVFLLPPMTWVASFDYRF